LLRDGKCRLPDIFHASLIGFAHPEKCRRNGYSCGVGSIELERRLRFLDPDHLINWNFTSASLFDGTEPIENVGGAHGRVQPIGTLNGGLRNGPILILIDPQVQVPDAHIAMGCEGIDLLNLKSQTIAIRLIIGCASALQIVGKYRLRTPIKIARCFVTENIIESEGEFHSEVARVRFPVAIARECKPNCKPDEALMNTSDGSGKLFLGSNLMGIQLDLLENLRA
jgi:hypothetical protein